MAFVTLIFDVVGGIATGMKMKEDTGEIRNRIMEEKSSADANIEKH